MKKFLTMALALMMILSLFAVPTMAAASTLWQEQMPDVTFENLAVVGRQANASSNSSPYYFAGENGYAKLVNMNGNKVIALIPTSARTNSKLYAAPTVNAKTGEVLELSVDCYIPSSINATQISCKIGTITSGSYIGLNSAKIFVNGEEYVSASNTPSAPYAKMIDFPKDQWFTYVANFTMKTDLVDVNPYLELAHPATGSNEITTSYIDNLSVKVQTNAWPLTITEANDFGTVLAPDAVAANGKANVIIIPSKGYYVHEITLNGTDVTSSLVKHFVQPKRNPYYVLTIDGTALTADADVNITYGYYTYIEMFDGGNGEGDFTGSSDSGNTIEVVNGSIKVASATRPSISINQPYTNTTGKYYTEGDYIISVDAMSPGGFTDMRLNAAFDKTISPFADDVSKSYLLASESYQEIPEAGEWGTFEGYFSVSNAKPEGSTDNIRFGAQAQIVTAVDGTYTVYYDNFSIKKMIKAGAAPITPVTPPAPTTAAVTINTDANANTSVAAGTVTIGEATTFTVAPKFGYYIQSITIGGTPFTGFDAYKGGTYTTGAIAADTAIVVTVAALSANTEDGVSTSVATLPAVFAETGEAPVTFGKVLADVATVDEFGIYLTTAEGDEVESAVTKMGPHFKAFYNVGGQYAIEFQGLAAGEYIAKTYVKVAGVTTYGIATTFTVSE